MSDRKFYQKKDIWIILGLLVVALGIWLASTLLNAPSEAEVDSGMYADIFVSGQQVQTVDLDFDDEFSLELLPDVRFAVQEGGISFLVSDCPDQVCVRSGVQRASGNFAACLPNGVLLWVEHKEAS